MDVITFHVNLWTTTGLSILLHDSISLSDATSCDTIQLLTYVEVDMECYWTVNVILTDAELLKSKRQYD